MSDGIEDPRSATPPHTGQPISPDSPGGQAPARAGSPAGAPQLAVSASPAAAATPPSQQQFAIRAALETVMDPEIGLSVVDLGLIREILVEPGATHIKMLLTTPFCPYAPQMLEDVKQAALSSVPQPCDVELLPDPWSPDLMPDPGLLGFSF